MNDRRFGVGLRHHHFSFLEEKPETKIDWFEGITENFLDTQGRPLSILEKIREDYPVGLHGVSLNIGSVEPLDREYLKKVKNLYQRIDPMVISDHLCWTGNAHSNLHNLLPLPYSEETMKHLVNRIDEFQTFMGRQITIENLSAYFEVKESTMTEWNFLNELAKRAGCKILLDINNIYVNAMNHKFDAYGYLDAIDNDLVGEIHLAGFSDMGTHLFDTHSKPVYPEVWNLYDYKIKNLKDVAVLIEWDEDIPEFSVLENEALKAKKIWSRHHGI